MFQLIFAGFKFMFICLVLFHSYDWFNIAFKTGKICFPYEVQVKLISKGYRLNVWYTKNNTVGIKRLYGGMTACIQWHSRYTRFGC